MTNGPLILMEILPVIKFIVESAHLVTTTRNQNVFPFLDFIAHHYSKQCDSRTLHENRREIIAMISKATIVGLTHTDDSCDIIMSAESQHRHARYS